jgi:hypothetical protein
MFLPVSYVARVPKDRRAPLSFAKEVFSIAFFHERGLSLPVTVFLPWLLLHYVLNLHHLTSGQVHHFAVFVTLCEAFLRLPPFRVVECFPVWNSTLPLHAHLLCIGSPGSGALTRARRGRWRESLPSLMP